MSEPTIITDAESFSLEMLNAATDLEDRDDTPSIPVVALATSVELSQSGIIIRIEDTTDDPDDFRMTEMVIENYNGHPRLYLGVGLTSSAVHTLHLDLKTGDILHHEPPRFSEE